MNVLYSTSMPQTTARSALLSLGCLLCFAAVVSAQEEKKVVNVPMGVVTSEAFQSASSDPIQPGEIDTIINKYLQQAGVKPAALTSDADFLRRASLDLTGELPDLKTTKAFLTDKSADKRAKLIDSLLESPKFAIRWADYWTNVVNARVTDPIILFSSGAFKTWLHEQFEKNTPWDKVVSEIVTATGELRRDKKVENGAVYFLLSKRGADAVTERAAETSRIFLGIQIQCAQCHDHPYDSWKREQFHQFAAYFGKTKERFVFEDKKIVGFKLGPVFFGEYRMTDADDSTKRTVVYPKFLDGKAPVGKRLSDADARSELARAMTSRDNPWFAAAFVNRTWAELLGQSFYSPVDDIGPEREAVYPELMARLVGSFQGSKYNVKDLFRAIMNSEAYQRQIRTGKSVDEHLMFAAVYPTKLQAESLWNSLEGTLGSLQGFGGFGKGKFGGGGFGRGAFGTKAAFLKEFGYDPSTKPAEVEGSISQALFLMNNPEVNRRIATRGQTTLGKILTSYKKDEDAVKVLYYHVLTREPSSNEMQRCVKHVQDVGNREEAFEDILWVLVNSTEFQTKR